MTVILLRSAFPTRLPDREIWFYSAGSAARTQSAFAPATWVQRRWMPQEMFEWTYGSTKLKKSATRPGADGPGFAFARLDTAVCYDAPRTALPPNAPRLRAFASPPRIVLRGPGVLRHGECPKQATG